MAACPSCEPVPAAGVVDSGDDGDADGDEVAACITDGAIPLNGEGVGSKDVEPNNPALPGSGASSSVSSRSSGVNTGGK